MGKLIAVIFIIIGLIGAMRRLLRNSRHKVRGIGLANKLRSGRIDKEKLADELDLFVASTPLAPSIDLHEWLKESDTQYKLGRFIVLYIAPVDRSRFLFVTTHHDEDFGLNARGKFANVKTAHQHNFLLKINEPDNKIEIYSNLYGNLIEKNQQTDFALGLFDYMNQKEKTVGN